MLHAVLVKNTAPTSQAYISSKNSHGLLKGRLDNWYFIQKAGIEDLPHQIRQIMSEVGWGRGCLCAGTSGEQRRGTLKFPDSD